MKRILLIIGLIILLAAIPVSVYLVKQQQDLRSRAAPATTLTFRPSMKTVNVGDSFDLEVYIDPASVDPTTPNEPFAVVLNIAYDPTVLKAETITNGTLFPNVSEKGVIDDAAGTASIIVDSGDKNVTVAGTVLTISFTALSPSQGPSEIRFTDTQVSALDEGANADVLVGTSPARITVVGVIEPTPTDTPIGGDKDENGCLIAAGYSWCEAKQECVQEWEEACDSEEPIGGDKDENGCLIAAGYSWCEAKQKCVQEWEESCDSEETEDTEESDETSSDDVSLTITSPIPDESTDTRPVFSGTAPANSEVTITVYSDPITTVVLTDENGNWTYTPDEELPEGPHDLVVSTADGYSETVSFVVASGGSNGAAAEEATPVAGNMTPFAIILFMGAVFMLAGIALR